MPYVKIKSVVLRDFILQVHNTVIFIFNILYLLCFHLKSDHLNTFIVMIRVWQLRVFFLLFLLVWFGESNKPTHIYAYAWVIENKLITVSFDLLSNYLIELNFFCFTTIDKLFDNNVFFISTILLAMKCSSQETPSHVFYHGKGVLFD